MSLAAEQKQRAEFDVVGIRQLRNSTMSNWNELDGGNSGRWKTNSAAIRQNADFEIGAFETFDNFAHYFEIGKATRCCSIASNSEFGAPSNSPRA